MNVFSLRPPLREEAQRGEMLMVAEDFTLPEFTYESSVSTSPKKSGLPAGRCIGFTPWSNYCPGRRLRTAKDIDATHLFPCS